MRDYETTSAIARLAAETGHLGIGPPFVRIGVAQTTSDCVHMTPACGGARTRSGTQISSASIRR
ncbi:MAG: hypothetical protein ACLTT1_01790 [[Clostridium] scindens]